MLDKMLTLVVGSYIYGKIAFEYFMYISLFFMGFILVCLGDSDLIFQRMAPWARQPHLVMNVLTLIFIVIVARKKEELSWMNGTIFIMVLLSFLFGYYGVPDWLQIK